MDKWEYLSLKVYWDGKLNKWVRFDNSATADTIHQLLNPLGGQGWELVAFEGSYQSKDDWVENRFKVTELVVTSWDTTAFRAIFKRRLA